MSIAYNQMAERLAPHRGDWLRKSLEVSGVSAKEMAELLDLSARTMTNYLGGHTAPKRKALAQWALRTGVPIEYLETGIFPTSDDDGTPVTVGYQSFDNVLAFPAPLTT